MTGRVSPSLSYTSLDLFRLWATDRYIIFDLSASTTTMHRDQPTVACHQEKKITFEQYLYTCKTRSYIYMHYLYMMIDGHLCASWFAAGKWGHIYIYLMIIKKPGRPSQPAIRTCVRFHSFDRHVPSCDRYSMGHANATRRSNVSCVCTYICNCMHSNASVQNWRIVIVGVRVTNFTEFIENTRIICIFK
jgi:hypothetical protein